MVQKNDMAPRGKGLAATTAGLLAVSTEHGPNPKSEKGTASGVGDVTGLGYRDHPGIRAEKKKKNDDSSDRSDRAERTGVPTKPGHTWVEDRTVKGGGYFRKLAAGETAKGSKPPQSVGGGVGAKIGLGSLAALAATGLAAAATTSPQQKSPADTSKLPVGLAIGTTLAGAGIVAGKGVEAGMRKSANADIDRKVEEFNKREAAREKAEADEAGKAQENLAAKAIAAQEASVGAVPKESQSLEERRATRTSDLLAKMEEQYEAEGGRRRRKKLTDKEIDSRIAARKAREEKGKGEAGAEIGLQAEGARKGAIDREIQAIWKDTPGPSKDKPTPVMPPATQRALPPARDRGQPEPINTSSPKSAKLTEELEKYNAARKAQGNDPITLTGRDNPAATTSVSRRPAPVMGATDKPLDGEKLAAKKDRQAAAKLETLNTELEKYNAARKAQGNAPITLTGKEGAGFGPNESRSPIKAINVEARGGSTPSPQQGKVNQNAFEALMSDPARQKRMKKLKDELTSPPSEEALAAERKYNEEIAAQPDRSGQMIGKPGKKQRKGSVYGGITTRKRLNRLELLKYEFATETPF